jgi:hypothetical protein
MAAAENFPEFKKQISFFREIFAQKKKGKMIIENRLIRN